MGRYLKESGFNFEIITSALKGGGSCRESRGKISKMFYLGGRYGVLSRDNPLRVRDCASARATVGKLWGSPMEYSGQVIRGGFIFHKGRM